jgi:hypothetical protein
MGDPPLVFPLLSRASCELCVLMPDCVPVDFRCRLVVGFVPVDMAMTYVVVGGMGACLH